MAGCDLLSQNRRRTGALNLFGTVKFAALLITLAMATPALATEQTAGTASMGIGLAGISDWGSQQPFIDVMKTARPWIGHEPGAWGGVSESELMLTGILDEQGWPMSIPTTLRGIGTLVLSDLPPEAVSLAGRYRVSFTGDGIVEVSGRAEKVRYAPGQVEFDFTPGPGGTIITINRTDRQKTGDYIRDMSIMKLDNLQRHAAGEIFNPDWLTLVDDFGTFRFMDWMNTNDALFGEWNNRALPGDYTYARDGVPMEIMVRLANEAGINPWFNMPHRADDAYFSAFAEYVYDNLDPSLTAYVEYSNEVWNWQFTQAVWAENVAKARWNAEYAWMQYYGLRTAEMATIWKDVFGDQADSRLVTVISTQTGWPGLEVDALGAPRWVEEDANNPRPADIVDAYAIAGYFGRVLGTPERAPMVRGWLTDSIRAAEAEAESAGLLGTDRQEFIDQNRFDAAIATAAVELRDGSVSGDTADTLADLAGNTFPYHANVAQNYGLDLIMYEGGTHVTGIAEIVDDDELTEFFIALNYSAEMGAIYSELLSAWHKAGGELFNVYADVIQPGKWGSWGALRHLDDSNPRWDALLSFKRGT